MSRALLLLASVVVLPGCPRRGPDRPDRGVAAVPAKGTGEARPLGDRLELRWDPKTGRGDVWHHYRGGDILRTCFHCAYPGYTGGLVIGNDAGSGMGFYPRVPLRGYRSINVFCAQDESIRDHTDGQEYTYGWSENFGEGADGKRLEYVRGRVLEAGPGRVVLSSENAGGCYRVTKVAATRAGARFWVLATRVSNRCQHKVSFDFFSGDDPWIGLYRSSDGDVGWTPEGLVRQEQALPMGLFTAGGLYDLGNSALGQAEGSFSGQANFMALDPAVPLPGRVYFANRFAHEDTEVSPDRPLDNKTLTALNLGWVGVTLEPGQGFTTAMALGLADTGEPGTLPRTPAITDEDWSSWRPHLLEDSPATGTPAAGAGDTLEFAAERVELDLTPSSLVVTGTYHLRNRGEGTGSVAIAYPVLTGPGRPAPASVLVDGRPVPLKADVPGRATARFQVAFPPRGLASFIIRYTQRHEGRRAAYMVTSANAWPAPIGRAVFVVRHPASMGRVRLSYPPDHTRSDHGAVEMVVVRHRFRPDREVEMRW